MNKLTKLEYPCPLCGGELFSMLCVDGSDWNNENEKCVVTTKNPKRESEDSKGCSAFCLFKCRGEDINIYASVETSCRVTNKIILKEFERLFSLIPLDKGFKI